jgi:arylsulfatase A-like enzyme
LLSLAHGMLSAVDKPNLIFILCDDLAMGDLGCYGQMILAHGHFGLSGVE